MSRVQKPETFSKDNQENIFLAKNIQVDMCTKYKNIGNHFLRDVV